MPAFAIMLSALMVMHSAMNIPLTKETNEKSMDFWVGTWEVNSYTPKPDGTMVEALKAGTNTISKIKGNKVIHEDFKSPGFTGESWSMYMPKDKTWRQTWVDDAGNYIVLSGGMVGDEFILTTSYPNTIQRMRFQNITKDSFTWLWEAKKGDEWALSWRIEYKRIK
ncbi:MAG: hypothetical protein KF824_02320 [Fimbriimonadaceae bacterium]|nr:MAG: hypothetical protein KF824_02320 [Fimbriimonadaceae bacterium]